MICNYFLQYCGLYFHSLNNVFRRAEVINFDKVQFVHSSFRDCTFGVVSKKFLLNARSQRFYSRFSSRSFIVLGFTIRSMIHFELIFTYRTDMVQIEGFKNFVLFCGVCVFSI